MGPLNRSVEYACLPEWIGRGYAPAAGAGAGVKIRLHPYDETNRRVRPDHIIRLIRKQGGRAFIGFVGVQSNQFPRAVDLARPFLKAGLPVSSAASMSPAACYAAGIAERHPRGRRRWASRCLPASRNGRLDVLLRDAYRGELKPLYNYMDDLPALAGEPPPFLARQHLERTAQQDVERRSRPRMPFQCSFCTIINVQGRKSRFRTPMIVERIVRENDAQRRRPFLHHRR